jgi:hypothetical protein
VLLLRLSFGALTPSGGSTGRNARLARSADHDARRRDHVRIDAWNAIMAIKDAMAMRAYEATKPE